MKGARFRPLLPAAAVYLLSCSLDPEAPCVPYDRESFHYGIDADHDCQYTRAELLVKTSLIPVTFRNPPSRCTVDSGKWPDEYNGDTLYAAADVEIDHRVALKEAFASGAHAWDEARKTGFANTDTLGQLVITATSTNRGKSDRDLSGWLPKAGKKDYVRKYLDVKKHWGLSLDPDEAAVARQYFPDEAPEVRPEYACAE